MKKPSYPFPLGGHSDDLSGGWPRRKPSYKWARLIYRNRNWLSVIGIAIVLIAVVWINLWRYTSLGVFGFGPVRTVEATVNRLYVDSGGGSHYMVATDIGIFEIDNGWNLGMYNADELYGYLKEGNRYRFITKGNKVVDRWYQEYPYIIEAIEIRE